MLLPSEAFQPNWPNFTESHIELLPAPQWIVFYKGKRFSML